MNFFGTFSREGARLIAARRHHTFINTGREGDSQEEKSFVDHRDALAARRHRGAEIEKYFKQNDFAIRC
jgi:hypothetical protein